jgi:hypothetical protein
MAFDLNAVTARIKTILADAGWNAYDTPVETVQVPAAVIGAPTSITYATTLGGTCSVDVPVKLVVQKADLPTGVRKLYTALSSGIDGSLVDLFVITNKRSADWRTLKINIAEGFDFVSLGEGNEGLGVSIALTITA